MALAEGKSSGNKVKVEKKKEKKPKKQKTEVKLPNAKKSIRRQRAMAQGKADFNGWVELITGIAIFLLILFILFGGINQRAFFETMGKFGQTIGEKISQFVDPDNVVVNENGIYYDLDGDGEAG